MSNYTQSTNFATKDALTSGNPLKIVKGTEINTEYANIAIAVATKADLTSPVLVTPNIGTPSAGVLTNCTGLPMTTGVTGTLPVANGGTGVTSSTGSGNNVLSTSPALTTPNIGTPSAGVLTSCTGLPMTTGVTGTLPVANGGTGVTASTGTTSVVLSASPTLTGTPTLPTGTIATTQSFGNSTTAIATTAFVQAAMALMHPVGSIYTAIISTNPGTLFGFGTWTAFGAGRMLISLDSGNVLFDTAEETGGFADSTLPTHTHTFTGTAHDHTVGGAGNGLADGSNSGAWYNGTSNTSSVVAGGTNANAGSTGVDKNYPPYIAVYMWKRTA